LLPHFKCNIATKLSNLVRFNQKFKTIKTGFTLAEVLITLAVIGVIAALTIPLIINSIEDHQYNVDVKDVYSILSRAIMSIQTNNAGVVNIGGGDTTVNSQLLRNDFSTSINFIKLDKASNIFPAYYSNYKGSEIEAASMGISHDRAAAIDSHGYYYYFFSYVDCTGGPGTACGGITVDINGSKKPNMIGKDLHKFWITKENGIYYVKPRGIDGDSRFCIANSTTSNSEGCTYQRLVNPNNMP